MLRRPDWEAAVRIVAGLGNPGKAYSGTRHNTGWMAIDKLARHCEATEGEDRCGGVLARCGRVWLFKPLSYMNLCGPPVARLCREAGVGPEGLLILADDLDLPAGAVRLRPGGSSGGHKGLVSVIGALGTQGFPRLRMGIGPCPAQTDPRDFVLSPFSPEERELIETATEQAAEAALCWIRDGVQEAMNRFNRKAQDQ